MYEFHPELCESEANDMNDAHFGHSQGFDDIHFEWSAKGAAAAQVLQKWIMDRKLTSRVEDLKPSELHGKLSWIDWVGWILGILGIMSFMLGISFHDVSSPFLLHKLWPKVVQDQVGSLAEAFPQLAGQAK